MNFKCKSTTKGRNKFNNDAEIYRKLLSLPSMMKYKVVCNSCQKPFVAETEKTGKAKFRCPNCGHVMVCQLGASPQPSLNRGVAQTTDSEDSIPSARERAVATGKTVYKAAQRSSSALQSFQKSHKNGDLWLFFGFGTLFVMMVIAGLFVGAELAKLIDSGRSWLFRLYLDIIHSL